MDQFLPPTNIRASFDLAMEPRGHDSAGGDPEGVASEAAIDDNVQLAVEDDEEPPPMLGLQPASISMRILSELEAETAAEADMTI